MLESQNIYKMFKRPKLFSCSKRKKAEKVLFKSLKLSMSSNAKDYVEVWLCEIVNFKG